MEKRTQVYAVVTNGSWRSEPAVPVQDEQDAVRQALASRGICFSTYETEIITDGASEFKGEARNGSARRYVGIDRVYNRDQMFKEIESIFGKMSPSDTVRQAFMKYPEDSVYITGLERPGEFIRISETEKVFNSKGGQLWPVPVPDVILKNDMTASRPLKLNRHAGPKR